MRRSFQPPGNPLTRGSVRSFGISEGNTIGREKKKPTEYVPNLWRSSLDARISHQRVGPEQGGAGYILRVGTGPECPEDSLRELT